MSFFYCALHLIRIYTILWGPPGIPEEGGPPQLTSEERFWEFTNLTIEWGEIILVMAINGLMILLTLHKAEFKYCMNQMLNYNKFILSKFKVQNPNKHSKTHRFF